MPKGISTLKTTWTGIRPLIMTNPQTVQLSNSYAVESRRLNGLLKKARKAEDADMLLSLERQQMVNDWAASAYWDYTEKKFFIPDTAILACIKQGATTLKKGKDIDRAVILSESQAYVQTHEFKSLNEAFEDPRFRLECPCKIPPKTGALIFKCRCMIPTGWRISFTVEFNEDFILTETLKESMRVAGLMCGLGGWRPKFGRFDVE